MNSVDEQHLYKDIQNKDPVALEKLYDKYEKLLYSFAYKMTNEATLAEEVVQDVFMKLWQGRARYDDAKGRFSSWLLTVTRYTALDHVRKAQKKAEVPLLEKDSLHEEPAPTAEDAYMWERDRETLRNKVSQLNEEQQTVIQLFYFQGLSQSKIAESCGIPLGTVKGRIRLALRHLKNSLDSDRGVKG